MPGVYVLDTWGTAILQDRHAADFWITGTWDTVDVFYAGF